MTLTALDRSEMPPIPRELECDSTGALRVTGALGGPAGPSSGLTDTQLRASPVSVTGPLTNTELRATALPVSMAAAPLPVGAATAARQDLAVASLSSIDTKTPALLGGAVPTVTQVSRGVASATIATATSVSGVIDCQQTVLVGLVMPAAWTSAALTVEVSADNAVWAPLVDATGAAVSIASPSLNTAYSLDLATMIPWRYVRLRSGTTAAPVAQGADRAVTVLTRPLA